MNDTLELLSKLIAIDTTSRNSNLELIYYVRDYLANHGIQSNLSFSSCNTKANLVATLPSVDGSCQGGIVLSGHSDVVPVDGQNWSYPAFEATILDDKVYGRGTCDMKGFIAVVLAQVPSWRQLSLKQPLHIAISYDEEVGCCGAPFIIKDIQERGLSPSACIVGEPTSMQAVVAHKGINIFRCHVTGRAAHSSLTNQGCNAIDYASELILKIRQLAGELANHGEQDNDYDVAYSTMSTNLISGGNAINTVPDSCEFYFDLRNLPHLSVPQIVNPLYALIEKDVLPRMRKEFADAQITLTQQASVPGLIDRDNQDLCKMIKEITNANQVKKVAYVTEAGLFQAGNIPTIVCGPGSINQAHRPDEYVTIEQLQECQTMLNKLIHQFVAE